MLGECISEHTGVMVGRDARVVADPTYAVLSDKERAAVLLEMGFMTDESDARQLFSAEWQKALAKAVADGIDALYNEKYID